MQPENLVENTEDPLKLGMQAAAEGDTERALACFETAALGKPNNPTAFLKAGNLLRDLERFDEAEAKYRTALSISPASAGALLGLAHVARKRNDPDSALSYLQRAQHVEPENPQVLMQLGNLYRTASRWEEATATYETVIRMDGSNARAMAFLGQIAKARGDSAQAIEFLQQAVAIDPNLPKAPSLLARLLRERGQTVEQEKPASEIAPLRKGRRKGLVEAIQIARSKDDDAAACEYLQAASAADPANVAILTELGATLRRLNRLEEAARVYEKALAGDEKNTKAHLGLAYIALTYRDPEAALVHFKAAADLEPENLPAQLQVADILVTQNRNAEADVICESVLAKSAQNPQILAALGGIARKAGNWEGAIRYLEAAAAADPAKPRLRIQLGRAYCDLLKADEAERAFRSVLESEPDNVEAIMGLGEVARLRNDTQSALTLFESAAKLAPSNLRIRAAIRGVKITEGSFDWRTEIEDALAVLRAPGASVGAQLTAATLLVEHGMTEIVQPVLSRLQSQSPVARQLILAVREIERMGLAQSLPMGATADNPADSQLESLKGFHEKPVAGSDTLLIVFAGRNNRIWLTFSLLHRILRAAGVSIVYVRDLQENWYTQGVVGLGDSYGATVEAFKSLAARYGARRILTLGNCVGCLGALRFGLSLGAQGVLGIAPNVRPIGILKPEFAARVEAVRRLLPAGHKDMHAQYAEAATRPGVTLVYGEQSEPDASDAKYMADIPGVQIAGIPNATDHDSVKDLLIRGLLQQILREFVAGGTLSPELLAKIAGSANP